VHQGTLESAGDAAVGQETMEQAKASRADYSVPRPSRGNSALLRWMASCSTGATLNQRPRITRSGEAAAKDLPRIMLITRGEVKKNVQKIADLAVFSRVFRLRARLRRKQDGVQPQPDASRGALLLREKHAATASEMPNKRNFHTDAERGQIQYNHCKANRYIPIVSPIAACIAKMQTNQRNRSS